MKYHLYHDESKIDGYWHGILLVPVEEKSQLIGLLSKVRENTGFKHSITIKNVKRTSGPIFTSAEAWLLLAVGAMRTKIGNETFPVHYGEQEKGKLKYELFDKCLGLKFILFRSLDDHQNMELLDTHAKRVETTFRFGLKGAMHYLGTSDNRIEVVDMHFDGHEHYGRHIDYNRIVGRLNGLRDYCDILAKKEDIHDHTSDHRKLPQSEYGDCQLLQLVDLLIGAFRTRLGHRTRDCHKTFAHIAELPIGAYQRGYAGYKNSRWFSSFWMSQCQIIDGKWQFSTLEYEPQYPCLQMSLDF